jgi:hypothetical protein
MPSSRELYVKLFESEAIEWNRIGVFEAVTMRLIAERLLPDGEGTTEPTTQLFDAVIQRGTRAAHELFTSPFERRP